MIFRNRFVSPQELVELIGAADIYITPYKHKGQVVSGTLAYALSAGKAIISTPYLHAIELLDEERGVLVPFDDPQAIAEKTIELLDNGTARHAMRKRAYLYTRDMVWDRVAQQYMGSFERVYNERLRNPRATFSAQNTEKTLDRLPAVKLDHLHRMTDHTGIVEHAVFVVPNYPEGYSTDDNARALIVAILLEEFGSAARLARLTSPRVIWLFCGWLSIQDQEDSGIASAMNASGRNRKAQKTATDAPCGDWVPFSAEPGTPGSGEPPDACLNWPFRRPWSSRVHELVLSLCSDCRNISSRSPAIAPP